MRESPARTLWRSQALRCGIRVAGSAYIAAHTRSHSGAVLQVVVWSDFGQWERSLYAIVFPRQARPSAEAARPRLGRCSTVRQSAPSQAVRGKDEMQRIDELCWAHAFTFTDQTPFTVSRTHARTHARSRACTHTPVCRDARARTGRRTTALLRAGDESAARADVPQARAGEPQARLGRGAAARANKP